MRKDTIEQQHLDASVEAIYVALQQGNISLKEAIAKLKELKAMLEQQARLSATNPPSTETRRPGSVATPIASEQLHGPDSAGSGNSESAPKLTTLLIKQRAITEALAKLEKEPAEDPAPIIEDLIIRHKELPKIAKAFYLDYEEPASQIYMMLYDDEIIIDKKIYELEKLLRMFEESKYLGQHRASTIDGTMGLRIIDLSDNLNKSYPVTLKGSGYAIRAISFTLTALKSLPKDDSNYSEAEQQKAKSLVTRLCNYHRELGGYNDDFKGSYEENEKASIRAQQGLYDLLKDQATTVGASFRPDPWYKRINFSKFKIAAEEESIQKKRIKAMNISDDCQLLTRPIVTATKQIGNVTITQTFTPVTRITEAQKAAWKQVADDAATNPIWFENFPKQFQQEYVTMAKDAVALEKLLLDNASDDGMGLQKLFEDDASIHERMESFKDLVAKSPKISERMKLRIAEDLTSNKAFKDFDPFFILAQTASSGNRCSPQASNLVYIHTVVKHADGTKSEDRSCTRSNENMMFDRRYKEDSNYTSPKNSLERSPFWQQGLSSSAAVLFQKTLPKAEAESFVKDTAMTLEQIYYNHIADSEEGVAELKQDLNREYARHWNFEFDALLEPTTVAVADGKQNFTHKPILFSSSLLSTLPGFIENGFLTRKYLHDRNRMMFYQKLLAFEHLRTSKQATLCGDMISMNFAANDYRKQAPMGFSNSVDRHNRHEAARLTLAVLNNLIVASDKVKGLNSLTRNLVDIYSRVHAAASEGKFYNLDRVPAELLYEIDQVSKGVLDFRNSREKRKISSIENMSLSLAATTEFIKLFKQRDIPKSANEQIMLACYAKLMVQSSSGSASQTDEHCKSGRDRTYTANIHEQAMKVYFKEYGELPTPDDSGKTIKKKIYKENKDGSLAKDEKGNLIVERDNDGKPIVENVDAREKFVDIFSDLFFTGLAQENSNQNQHGSFGLQNLTVLRKWPLCLIFGTVNPKETCMLPYDIQEKLKDRDYCLLNNKNLRNLGKISKRMKEKVKKTPLKKVIAIVEKLFKLIANLTILALSPLAIVIGALAIALAVTAIPIFLMFKLTNIKVLQKAANKIMGAANNMLSFSALGMAPLMALPALALAPALPLILLCCKITGSSIPRYNPIFTGLILFSMLTLAAAATILSVAMPIVPIVVAATAAMMFIIGANGLDPERTKKSRIEDIVATTMITIVISIIMINPIATAALALPLFALPIILCVAAVAATITTTAVKAVMPSEDKIPDSEPEDQKQSSKGPDNAEAINHEEAGHVAPTKSNAFNDGHLEHEAKSSEQELRELLLGPDSEASGNSASEQGAAHDPFSK